VDHAIVVAGQPSRNRPTGRVILLVLLLAFPLLALLVLEQGRVIDAQRLLIWQLNSDSQQLHSMRVREMQNRARQAAPAPKAPSTDAQQQPGTQQQPEASPERKNRKRHESKQISPPPPQEYPVSRRVPARKSA